MEQHGIPVATCNFEDFRPDTAFDCIVHYCVLEHAVDPLAFLRRQRRLLAPGGRVICAVPDCGDALDAGDISMFIHQHWSYFSAASLRRVATAAGLRVEGEQRAAVGALLYFSLRAPAGDQASEEGVPPGRGAAASPPAGEAVDPATFVARGRQALRRVDGWVRDAHRGNRSLGIYCPVRAINYVPEGSEAWDAVRLFDDAPALRGKYLPPFTRAIEGGDGLEREAVDEVLIMSRPFGAAIEAAIRARPLRAQPRIVHIEDLLAHD
jgi:SAM-dependent methyltransferase